MFGSRINLFTGKIMALLNRHPVGNRLLNYRDMPHIFDSHLTLRAFLSRWRCLEVRFALINTSTISRNTASCMSEAWLSRDPATLRTHSSGGGQATYSS